MQPREEKKEEEEEIWDFICSVSLPYVVMSEVQPYAHKI